MLSEPTIGRRRSLSSFALGKIVAVVMFLPLFMASGADALDTDIFTSAKVDPNVLIVFDNSGSMGTIAYNVYPGEEYAGGYLPGVVYSRCRSKNGVAGGSVRSDCSCRKTQSTYEVDESSCAGSFVDLIPGPGGDDIDDRESRRRRGNRLNFESNPPMSCSLDPSTSCSSDSDCPGVGDSCAEQNKMAIAKSVMIAALNNPAHEDVRFGMTVFNPASIDYNTFDYFNKSAVASWHNSNGAFLFPIQDMDSSSRAELTSAIQGLSAEGGTPTTHRLIDAWEYFNGQVSASGFSTSPVEETCQRNYVLMVTDGVPEVEADELEWTQSDCTFESLQSFVGTPGDLNGDGKENPASPAYLANTGEMFNCGSDYLDDAVIKIREQFPLGNSENQPLSLYAISFGFDYCQEPDEGDLSPGAGSLLWRASEKYGGGECLSAADPQDLDDALREAINLIKNDAQAFVAPVVPVSQTNRTESGDRLYVALFSPREGASEWSGNLKKYGLNKDEGAICNASTPECTLGGPGAATLEDGTILATAESFWDASSGGPSGNSVTSGGVGGLLLQRDVLSRKIYTYGGPETGDLGGVDLTAEAQAFDRDNALLTPGSFGLSSSDTDTRDELIDYVHGLDAFDADDDGQTTDKRAWILGDIIHSVPLIVRYDETEEDALILVGANDGLLHAFDDETGEELWAFLPPDVLPNLHLLQQDESSAHPYFVDGSPKIFSDSDQKIVVFGLGRGGRAYYALDITNRTAPRLVWRINSDTPGYSELGYSHSTPALTKFGPAGGAPVAIVGAGYDFYFDAEAADTPNPSGHGRGLYAIDLLSGERLGFAQAPGMTFAIPSDPLVFDINGDGQFDRGYIGDLGGNLWRIRDDFQVERLFATPTGQRIFYPPDAVVNAGSVMVYFGTGDRSNPLSTDVADRFYAVRDTGLNDLNEASLVDVTLNAPAAGSPEDLALANAIAAKNGWYLRLEGAGEKILASPTVFFNVGFATFTPSGAACAAGGDARIYLINPLNGAPTLDLAGTSGGNLGDGSGLGSGPDGDLLVSDRWVLVGQSIPTSLKVTFGDDETKAFFGVTKGGGIALQPLALPQIASNVIPVDWRQVHE